MGDRRRLVVSTWDIMTDIWIKNNTSLLDRPSQAGLTDKIGVDISSAPMTPQIRKCRQAGLVS
jgi:phenylacetate 2-hydroxylase